jgi:hypothetical protein
MPADWVGMNYISLHSLLGLGLVALVAGCSANDGQSAAETSADVTGAEQLHFQSATIVPFSSLSLSRGHDGSIFASYVSEDQLVVAKSLDNGINFTTVGTARHGSAGAQLFAAPSDENVLYLTRVGFYSWGGAPPPSDDVDGFLLRSDDGGKTWTDLTSSLPSVSQASGFRTLDINPTDPHHLVAANCNGLQKSVDGGKSWSVVPGSASSVGDCNGADMARGINDRKTIYILSDVGEGGGSTLRRSFDDGVTWDDAKLNVNADYMVGLHGLTVHPDDARHIYISDINSFYSSADGGDDFFRHGTNLDKDPSTVAVNPANGGLYMTKNDSVLRWVPSSEPENGHWSVVAKVPGAQLGEPTIIDENLYVTTGTQLLVTALP